MNKRFFIATAALCGSALVVGQFGSATAGEGSGGESGFAPGADVIVGAIPNVATYTAVTSGGVTTMAYAFGTTSCNIGTAQLEWFQAPDNRHPFIPMNAYRWKGNRFEHIGMGWGKHGFTALQQTLCGPCTSSGTGTYLGVGCSDPYSASLNGSQSGLGTRTEVNASTGTFPGTFNSGAASASTSVHRRVQIRSTDLDPAQNAGARYVSEGHYIHQQDATAGNDNNNASWREFTVGNVGANGSRALTLTGATFQQKAAIEAWKTFDPAVTISTVDVSNDGRFIVGCKVTDNGNGTWHYEYAVHNFNSHRSGRSFSVPVPAGTAVTNAGFKDINYHSGDPYDPTDWTISISGGAVTWTGGDFAANPNGNALRFATLYNFWFDASSAPVPANAAIGLFRPGAATDPTSVTVAVDGPGGVPPNPADLDGNGTVNGADLGFLLAAWGACPAPCPADLDGNGEVNGADLGMLLAAWG